MADHASATAELQVVEFFSGIGGLHYALRRAGVPHRVVRAYDVDVAAMSTYRHNMPQTSTSTIDLLRLKGEELRAACGRNDVWLLSPPCQPYTRQGLQLAANDGRASALEHLLDMIEGDASLLPSALLLENVVGFESSASRARLHAALVRADYCVRELWVSPAMLGVPNQRTRYFIVAKRGGESLPAVLPVELARVTMLDPRELDEACAPGGTPLTPPRGELDAEIVDACAPLSDYLEPRESVAVAELAVPEHVLERYAACMDLVGRHSRRSLCFTKNYARYVKGTGSILCEAMQPDDAMLSGDDKSLAALKPLAPRYFAPRELARLHGFPDAFAFPPEVSRKKQYELVGNSLSVQVVAALLRFLLASPPAEARVQID